METSLDVRHAEPGDAEELGDLHLRCRREAYAGLLSANFFEQQNLADRIARWSQILTGPHAARHWVAVHDGRLIGFSGSIPPGTSSVTELWGIYLLSAYHGSGLGQRLLEATIGTESAMLWVAQDNPRAQAFYRRNGFIPNGTRKVVEDWEGITLIQMSR